MDIMSETENEIIVNEQLRIPMSELQYRFSTSSGPGGQHANKASTRVTLIYDVAHSPSLDEEMRRVLLKRLAPYLDKDGLLQIHVQDSRSQHRNREIANGRFRELLAAALIRRKRRHPTRPNRKAIEKRLAAKKKRSQRKQERRQQFD
jgi:ribosome-associated protein